MYKNNVFYNRKVQKKLVTREVPESIEQLILRESEKEKE
jgi:hypothetical protein